MTVERIAHYRVNRLLGVGGMGEVYLGDDERLRRKVALKLLPERVSADAERVRRFQREAHAASALNHPNIITIYDIGQSDERHYIVTEYVEGVTLRERMIREPRLRLEEVIEIAIGIAKALGAAHDAGIVHRDIKPENIMLRPDGLVKVLDFGLAKIMGAPNETVGGEVMGTLLYMSPEQAHGAMPDARSDIYSLGVVLYEALTGATPYAADNFLELAQAITTKTIPPPSKLLTGLPPEIDRIVMSCLNRTPEKRYQRAADLISDLMTVRQILSTETLGQLFDVKYQSTDRWSTTHGSARRKLFAAPLRTPLWQRVGLAVLLVLIAAAALVAIRRAGAAAGPIESVAVLPFANATGDASMEYLSDGIAESLIDSLSQLRGVRVAARNMAFRYKKQSDPLLAGRELRMRAIVTGEVRQQGKTLIVRASLIDVDDGTQLWGQRFTSTDADILALQQRMAEEIFSALRVELEGTPGRQNEPTRNSEAFQLYLKGRHQRFKLTEEGARKGIELFKKAIDVDPTYALAYAGLADAYYALSNLWMAPREAMPRAREAAKRALELDDSLALAHTSLALVLVWYDWDFDAGEKEFQRAIALNPNDAESHRHYGHYLTAIGEFDRALAEKLKAVELDPLSVAASYDVARTLFFAGRLDEAARALQSTLELDGRSAQAHALLSQIAIEQGRGEEALRLAQQALELSARSPNYVALWGYIHARMGNRNAAIAALSEIESKASYSLPLLSARIHAGLGETENALRWLEQAYNDRSESMIWLKVDPTFNSCRDDPRFQALLARTFSDGS
jgi:TolB-like protein/Tfp pilus assembly protein PilF/predicted Ser/Thr protein kinase